MHICVWTAAAENCGMATHTTGSMRLGGNDFFCLLTLSGLLGATWLPPTRRHELGSTQLCVTLSFVFFRLFWHAMSHCCRETLLFRDKDISSHTGVCTQVTHSSHVTVESRCCRRVTLRVTLLSLLQSPCFLYSSHPLKSRCCRVPLLFFTAVTNSTHVTVESRIPAWRHHFLEAIASRVMLVYKLHKSRRCRVTLSSVCHVAAESSHELESRCCLDLGHIAVEWHCCRCVKLLSRTRVALLSNHVAAESSHELESRCCLDSSHIADSTHVALESRCCSLHQSPTRVTSLPSHAAIVV